MANYYNLESLSGLSVGDTITYNQSCQIDLADTTVNISMVGYRNQSAGGRGGWVSFDFNGNGLPTTLAYKHLLTFGRATSLIYGNFYNSALDEYYRIAVPGDTGFPGKDSDNATKNGGGGGLNTFDTSGAAGNGNDATTAGLLKGRGGRINAGGTGYPNGSFGAGGDNGLIPGNLSGAGGYGWYGGGAGQSNGTYSAGGGGGSSFVLTLDTYNMGFLPSGYMGDDAALIQDLASRASNLQYVRSYNQSQSMGTMVITILSLSSPTLTNLAWGSTPTKTTYELNEGGGQTPLDLTGATVYAVYSDGTTVDVTNDVQVGTVYTNTTGEQTVYVSYNNHSLILGFTVTVVGTYVDSISLSGNYPTQFSVGDAFSSSGLIVTANYNDGTSAVTNNYSISAPNMSGSGTRYVEVTYTGSDIINPDFPPSESYAIRIVEYIEYIYLAPAKGYDYIGTTALTATNAADRPYNHAYGGGTLRLKGHTSGGNEVFLTTGSSHNSIDYTTLGSQTITYSYRGSSAYPIDPNKTSPLTTSYTVNVVDRTSGVYRFVEPLDNHSDTDVIVEKHRCLVSHYNNNAWNDGEVYYYDNVMNKGMITIEPYTYTHTNVTCDLGTVESIADENQLLTGYKWTLPAGTYVDGYAHLSIEFEGSFPPGNYSFSVTLQSEDSLVTLENERAYVYDSTIGYIECRHGGTLPLGRAGNQFIYVPSYAADNRISGFVSANFENTPASKIKLYLSFDGDGSTSQNDIVVTLNKIRPTKTW